MKWDRPVCMEQKVVRYDSFFKKKGGVQTPIGKIFFEMNQIGQFLLQTIM